MKQVRLVSAKAERPNHQSRGEGGSASQGGEVLPARGGLPAGVLHDNDADLTP